MILHAWLCHICRITGLPKLADLVSGRLIIRAHEEAFVRLLAVRKITLEDVEPRKFETPPPEQSAVVKTDAQHVGFWPLL